MVQPIPILLHLFRMRKFLKRILFILFLLKCIHLNAQTLDSLKAANDLGIFKDALNRYHPELYKYIDSSELSNEFKNAQLKIKDSITLIDFYNVLRGISAKVKDGHLKIIPNGKDQDYPYYQQGLFPLELYFEKNKTFVIGSFENVPIPTNFQILSINGLDIDTIKKSMLSTLTFGDGDSVGGKYYQLNRYFAGYFSSQYGTSPQYTVVGKVGDQFLNFTFVSTSKDKIESYFNSKQKLTSLDFKMVNEEKAVLTIPQFYPMKGEMNFYKFLKNAFNQLRKKHISTLIIDVRGNEGGIEKYGIELYRYLAKAPFTYYDHLSVKPNSKSDYTTNTSRLFLFANIFSKKVNGGYWFPFGGGSRVYKPNKLNYQGNVILLVDGQCFSVTTEFAAKVKSDKRAIILGMETAGGITGNSSGFFTIVNLPNSNIDVGIPRIGFNMSINEDLLKLDGGIMPDEEIEVSAENRLKGLDPVLSRALK